MTTKGKVIRDKVLKPGYYWTDSFNEARGVPHMLAWLRNNKEKVQVIKQEFDTSDYWPNVSRWTINFDAYRMWTVFKVKKPVVRWKASAKYNPLPTFVRSASVAHNMKAPSEYDKKKESIPEYWSNRMQKEARDFAMGSTVSFGAILFILALANSNKKR